MSRKHDSDYDEVAINDKQRKTKHSRFSDETDFQENREENLERHKKSPGKRYRPNRNPKENGTDE